MIKDAVAKLISSESLARTEAVATMTDIMAGNATEAQIGAMNAKPRPAGDSANSIPGCAEAMPEGNKT
ncbi:hypothetical protein [Pontiella sulfatireligans]|uniref:Glycosyl transferase family 3 N-terminal domain-containing protein n=1 Tax=Pontiella sulfatireligans TaxID=2750658 RepID=A0A6C2ULB3_9BACT|nr:hypothetical protein [Pontiella sulfatireligans]VGO19976.1 hypothetical protein SCARR_02036 [Pontiella sulfatireligans]